MPETANSLEIRRLTIEWKNPLLHFFRVLEQTDDSDFFRPHPFTDAHIERILRDSHRDLYYLLSGDSDVLAYGLLRGWDEGYDIPSLGIAVHPRVRGTGLGRAFMHFLAATAKYRGAQKVRLRVMSTNRRAIKLYESLGYRLTEEGDGNFLAGFLDLQSERPSANAL